MVQHPVKKSIRKSVADQLWTFQIDKWTCWQRWHLGFFIEKNVVVHHGRWLSKIKNIAVKMENVIWIFLTQHFYQTVISPFFFLFPIKNKFFRYRKRNPRSTPCEWEVNPPLPEQKWVHLSGHSATKGIDFWSYIVHPRVGAQVGAICFLLSCSSNIKDSECSVVSSANVLKW